MKYIALLVFKITLSLSRMLGKGSSFPGVLARKIDKNILSKIKYPKIIIAVTGTNGKTSTTNLIASILKDSGYSVTSNGKGANLLGGLFTSILSNTSFGFKLNSNALLLEIDEATYVQFTKYVTPSHLVVTNIFRDQLDRYTEIEVLVNLISSGIQSETCLVLNGDDPLVHLIGLKNPSNKKLYYGLDKTNYSKESSIEVREGKYCPNCCKKLLYNYYHYSQLGEYYCSCGFKRPKLDYMATDVDLASREFKVDNNVYHLNYDNIYFIYNALIGVLIGSELNVSYNVIHKSLANYILSNGRMESFNINGHSTYLNLVKNATGLNQAFYHVINQCDDVCSIHFTFNNLVADGRDTSWIWDVDFEALNTLNLDKFICSGIRRYDLATRLKYANIDKSKIIVCDSVQEGIEYIAKLNSKPYFLSTYTALQENRNLLKKRSMNSGDKNE